MIARISRFYLVGVSIQILSHARAPLYINISFVALRHDNWLFLLIERVYTRALTYVTTDDKIC